MGAGCERCGEAPRAWEKGHRVTKQQGLVARALTSMSLKVEIST